MNSSTNSRSCFLSVALSAISLAIVGLPIKSFGWSITDNGLYSGLADGNGTLEVRVGPLPAQNNGSVPQSTEVYDRTIALLSAYTGLRLNTQWSGNTALIAVSGNMTTYMHGGNGFGSISISGTVSVTPIIVSNSGNSTTIRTTVSANGTVGQRLFSESLLVTELIQRNSPNSISYSAEAGGLYELIFNVNQTQLDRVSLGTGTERRPFLPPNPNWRVIVIVIIIPILPNRPTNFDPPFAKGFDYKIASGRTESVEKVYAPKGFGKKIKVYASAKSKGPLKLVGTVASGKNLSLTKAKGLKNGAQYVRMQGMRPRPDLAKDAPYPVGFTFRNLSEATAKVEIYPLKAK